MRRDASSSRGVEPPPEPKRPSGVTVEVYGFVGWMTSFFAFAIFIFWAYLPERFLFSIGVTYFPDKYWALAGPTFLCFTIIFVVVMYICVNLINTEPLESYSTIVDVHSRTSEMDEALNCVQNEESIPPIADIPIHQVNKLLYQQPSTSKDSAATMRRAKSYPLVSAMMTQNIR
eukprot:TRINITY_DN2714_c0_g1_i1.p1 TRINITY_DN2714_c0_g1~~TRINITY_DN2714_c0_g1_i1.p1  ORF type:complete len:174 (+),score=27.21 TRINITY_DN2714_c0_g1_i1:267-788(+)